MADEKKVSGKTRAGTTAKPFPWEEAIGEQYERTKSRLKGLVTEPEAELQRILEQYLPKKGDSREERMQKLEDLAMGFAGTVTPGLSWAGKTLPAIEKLAKAKDKFLYHSDVASSVPNLQYGIEPQQGGKWIKEVAEGTGVDPKEIFASQTPMSWFSDTPTWVKVKVARELNKHVNEVTVDDIKKYGHLAIVNKKDPYLTDIWKVGESGLMEGPYSKVKDLQGQQIPAYQTNMFQEGLEPFGVERNEWVSTQSVEPFLQLTGDDLVKFLELTGEIKKPQAKAQKKADGGLAQYGLRHSGEGVKGKGYFGLLPNKMDGVSTEISVEDETGEYPLIVPTLTAEELDRLLAGKDPTAEMMEKASSWAATRRKRGKSPFASPTEVRMPRPKAEGGPVNLTDLPDEVTPANWREHLQNNVLADARALLGVKDGGVINLDELIEKSLKKKDGGVINLDELIDWTLAKDEHRKMKEKKKANGGGVFNTDPDITDSGRIIPHNI
jgi:hypothetical protein